MSKDIVRGEMLRDQTGERYDERTVRAVIALLESSKARVHHGAAKRVAEHFLPDGRFEKARLIAAEKGWPIEAVLAGVGIGDLLYPAASPVPSGQGEGHHG